ncbi:MAG: glutamate--tRNA ligase [Legionellales bacterium RIFCSPHIGHO2_12_FULL_42_9]|nr:MAG: glutamate--tRNA ligase [Legionellales bacterium RIFCSPHIGHO2_12_FULL_42_9]
MLVRTRFAPSPTGFLHVGGVRTALFSWLYAKHNQGEFILRIEDTDRERSTPESIQAILDGMAWLGLDYDEGPVYQTNRYPCYQEAVLQLVAEKKAYRCVCSKERLASLREKQLAVKEKPRYDGHCRELDLKAGDEPFVVRFKNPLLGIVSFHDQVYGDIHVDNRELDDLVLIRSDGHPTYNFAVVIDDWDMGITHVIRGDDHINNTPKQINLFNAFNAPIPVFAHLPMILGDDGKRLSKRHGAVNVMQFKEEGYLPHALLNYLVRLGWSAGDQEIFSLEEMIAKFDLSQVSRGSAGFNYEKLQWLNQHYLKHDPVNEVERALRIHYAQRKINLNHGPLLTAVIPVFAERCKTLVELCEMTRFLYEEHVVYNEEAVKKQLQPTAVDSLRKLSVKLESLTRWKAEAIHQCIHELCEELSLGMGKIAQPLRVAVTGGTTSPSIDITLELLGKKRTLERLDRCLGLRPRS